MKQCWTIRTHSAGGQHDTHTLHPARRRAASGLVQHQPRYAGLARPSPASGDQGTRHAGLPGSALPHALRPGSSQRRALHRDPRAGARAVPTVSAFPAPPRLAAGEGARYPGAYLLQVRRRQPRRIAQDQHRHPAGLLRQGRRRQGFHHRDRRRSVGNGAGPGLQLLRAGMPGLHGARLLRPETVPPRDHGDLRRQRFAQPVGQDAVRAQAAEGPARSSRLAGRGDLGSGRSRGQPPTAL